MAHMSAHMRDKICAVVQQPEPAASADACAQLPPTRIDMPTRSSTARLEQRREELNKLQTTSRAFNLSDLIGSIHKRFPAIVCQMSTRVSKTGSSIHKVAAVGSFDKVLAARLDSALFQVAGTTCRWYTSLLFTHQRFSASFRDETESFIVSQQTPCITRGLKLQALASQQVSDCS